MNCVHSKAERRKFNPAIRKNEDEKHKEAILKRKYVCHMYMM